MDRSVFILLLISFTSCTKDITIDLDGHESKPVVNSFFSPYDTLCVNISKSIPLLDDDRIAYIDDATVELFCNGSFIGGLLYDQEGNYILPVELEPEQEYSLAVTAADINTVSSHNIIPPPVAILSFDTVSVDSRYLYCEITFQDIPGLSNYYLLEVILKYPVLNSDSVFSDQVDIIISDFIVENGSTGDKRKRIYFSDDEIQGTEYELSFILDKERMLRSFNDSTNIAFINFKTISKEYYTYVKTYDESQNRQMDVFTNIENGYGIFAGYNVSRDSIVY